MSNLKIKAARGGMYMAAVTFAMRPVSMILAILIARLLVPEDFGLLALALILLNATNFFTDLGMRPTVVQSKEDINKVAYYAFVIVMVTSITFTLLFILLARPLSNLLGGGAELVPILRWMALYMTLDGLWVIPEALLRRELRFKQLSVSQIPAELASTAIAIPLAMAGFGVWSLVAGYLLGQVTRIFLLWWFYRPWIWLRPQKWDKEIVKGMFRFGLPSVTSGLTKYFQGQVDTFVVGRQLGAAAVGIYSKAFALTMRLSNMLTAALFGNVLFSSYAKMQDDKPKLARAYLFSNQVVTLIIMPVAMGSAITAPILIPVLLGPQWIPMIPLWEIFSLYGLTRPISANSAPLFLATGQPKRNLTATLVLLAVLLPLLFLLVEPYGTVGAALAVSAASVVGLLFNVFQVNQILPGTAMKTVTQSLPIFLAGSLMVLSVVLAWNPVVALAGGENLIALILLIVIAAIVYLGAIFLLMRPIVLEVYELLVRALGIDKRWPRLIPTHPKVIK